MPDSALLARQVATASGGRASVGATVASTPVVLAVPDGQQAPDPVAWGSTIVARNTRLPDPTTSTVGRVTLMAGLAELDGVPADQRSAALAGIGGMLSRVVPEETLLTAHVRGGDAAVFPTTEQQVQRAAVKGLVVRTAASTTPALEYSLVTTPYAPPEAAEALTRALTGDAGQAALRDAGFRTPDDPTPTIDGGPPAGAVGAAVTPDQAQAAEQMWTAIATPTRLLTVIDTCGSMDQRASEGEGSRTELGGDTGLYDTVAAAYEAAVEDYDPKANNLVALFTDGVDHSSGRRPPVTRCASKTPSTFCTARTT